MNIQRNSKRLGTKFNAIQTKREVLDLRYLKELNGSINSKQIWLCVRTTTVLLLKDICNMVYFKKNFVPIKGQFWKFFWWKKEKN